jgi:hypothetical protein
VHKLGLKSPRTTKGLLDITTSDTSREYTVGAIFDHSGQKAKRDKESDEGSTTHPKARTKGDRWQQADMLVVAADQRGRRPPAREATNHFKKLLETPCPNHRHLV